MKDEEEIRRRYDKLVMLNEKDHLTVREKYKLEALEWVLHDPR